jgi:outer membrane protein assembly factor BamB
VVRLSILLLLSIAAVAQQPRLPWAPSAEAQPPLTGLNDDTPFSGEVWMIEVEGEGAKYWPRWRGPSGQGVVAGKGYVDSWSDTDNVLWRTPVPGRGHSSPIVWADRIFLTTGYPDGRRSILCFRRSDGKQLWETFVSDAPAERLYPKNSPASGTPSTDGQLVYAYFGNAGLVAVDFTGKLVWRCDLGPVSLYHGTIGSPLLYQDRVIIYQDQKNNSYIAAVDKKTGKQIWRTPRQEQIGWSSAVAIRAVVLDVIVL